jgi:acyl-coenzyme A synthetase/AMP-(fatty) acid ligase
MSSSWCGGEIASSTLLTEGDWTQRLAGMGVGEGSVCAFRGDYSPSTCALMLALMRVGAILVPFARATRSTESCCASARSNASSR